ncbi:MAG TPA: lipopolysaccharide biosynthesis protein [Dermatophilaceae bacterium]|nr:lipopolysaccharide biosynthesis protein [Dermatophilaceae bacterium]
MTDASAVAAAAPVRRRSPLLVSMLGLVTGKGLQLGAGFVFWVLAARSSGPAQVGLVAAATSAVLLCTQLGQLGTGTAVILSLRGARERAPVLDGALTLVLLAGLACGGGFLVVVAVSGGELSTVSRELGFAGLFLISTVAGTVMVCLDQVNIALGRGGNSSLRYAVAAAATIGITMAAATTGLLGDPRLLFACWTLGSVAACTAGAVQLRRAIRYRYRPERSARRLRSMLGVGLPNQLLTLAERSPGQLVPILLAHLVSLEATAYWYPAWMMAWVAYSVPTMTALVALAEGVHSPAQFSHSLRAGLRWSLLVGAAIAVVLGVLAEPLLGLLGARYAEGSVAALRILAVGVIPYTVVQMYNAACRGRGRLTEALVVNTLLALATCAATIAVGHRGPSATAAAWLVCLSVAATGSWLRTRSMVRSLS